MINDINQQTMTKSVFLSILLWIFIYPLRVRAIESINFIHIGVNEGLSQNTVFDITQDKQGNMWFATYDGLNKYDGYDFTIYRHNESDPHSIGSVIVRACITDTQGRNMGRHRGRIIALRYRTRQISEFQIFQK